MALVGLECNLGFSGLGFRGFSGVISKVTRIITQIRGLITPLITTHEAPRDLYHKSVHTVGLGLRVRV